MSFRGERKKLDLGKYSVVVYERAGKKYEIIVDPKATLEYRKGKQKSLDEVVAIIEVFHDAQKGQKASLDELRELVFRGAIEKVREKKGTKPSKEEAEAIQKQVNELEDEKVKELAVRYILEKGELKLPKELRDELLQKLERRIISYLQKYAINPATKAPYPPSKIEEALKQAISGVSVGGKKIRVALDPLMEFEDALPLVVDALKAIMPIRLEIIVTKVHVPAQYTGIAYSRLEKYGTVKESKWLDDGSLEAVVEVPGGQFMLFNNALAEATKRTARVEVLERKIIG